METIYIERAITPRILEAAKFYSVIIVTGPRQTGKTTMCRHIFEDFRYYNLENIALRTAIMDDPLGFLKNCGDKVILDECQNYTDIFSYIQVIVDENKDRKFILTGSNNFSLMEKTVQSMAGRAALFTLLPFALSELPKSMTERATDTILLDGFYPATLVKDTPRSLFYSNYYTTYIERDVRQIKQITDLGVFQRMVRLLAGRVGTELNTSSLANETGMSAPAIKSWINVLEASYIVYTLPPYFTNIPKRLTKSPKIYFYDSGLLCYLLDIHNETQLKFHPLRGAIFENMIVSQTIKARVNAASMGQVYFYRENAGREVDLLVPEDGGMNACEIKSSETYNTDFAKNLKYIKNLLPDNIINTYVIYDGESVPPSIYNFRDYFR